MLTMLYTWQAGDCSDQQPYNGDFAAAMKGIKAKTLVLPGKTDLYFRKTISLLCRPIKLTTPSARGLRERSRSYVPWCWYLCGLP